MSRPVFKPVKHKSVHSPAMARVECKTKKETKTENYFKISIASFSQQLATVA